MVTLITCFQNLRQVREHLLRLRGEVADTNQVALLVDGRLARGDQQVADAKSLRNPVGGQRVRLGPDLHGIHGRSISLLATVPVG